MLNGCKRFGFFLWLSFWLPIIFGSARMALEEQEESEMGSATVLSLMNTVDDYVKQQNVF